MDSTEIARRITELLETLPTDSIQIAELFREKGIKGTRGNPSSCPVATWLLAELTEHTEFLIVGKTYAYVPNYSSTEDPSQGRVLFEDSFPHVVSFIEEFDDGIYPFLGSTSEG